jgi:Transposase
MKTLLDEVLRGKLQIERTAENKLNLPRFDGHGNLIEKERTRSEKRRNQRHSEEFKRQAVELLINSGKPQAQLARKLGCSDMSLSGWKRKYFKSLAAAKQGGSSTGARRAGRF